MSRSRSRSTSCALTTSPCGGALSVSSERHTSSTKPEIETWLTIRTEDRAINAPIISPRSSAEIDSSATASVEAIFLGFRTGTVPCKASVRSCAALSDSEPSLFKAGLKTGGILSRANASSSISVSQRAMLTFSWHSINSDGRPSAPSPDFVRLPQVSPACILEMRKTGCRFGRSSVLELNRV